MLPGAHVQIWVLVIGLLPTEAKVKLLGALCCCFLRVTLVFCSPQSHVLLLQLEEATVVSCFPPVVVYFHFNLIFICFIIFIFYNFLLFFLCSVKLFE